MIGFGNILSSMEELSIEAENATGIYRNLNEKDFENFNSSYINAIICSINLFLSNKINFEQIYQYIEFFINKDILSVLKNKEKDNRLEVSKLLFEFKNEMVLF